MSEEVDGGEQEASGQTELEHAKLKGEVAKLVAEARKLDAEARKLTGDANHYWRLAMSPTLAALATLAVGLLVWFASRERLLADLAERAARRWRTVVGDFDAPRSWIFDSAGQPKDPATYDDCDGQLPDRYLCADGKGKACSTVVLATAAIPKRREYHCWIDYGQSFQEAGLTLTLSISSIDFDLRHNAATWGDWQEPRGIRAEIAVVDKRSSRAHVVLRTWNNSLPERLQITWMASGLAP